MPPAVCDFSGKANSDFSWWDFQTGPVTTSIADSSHMKFKAKILQDISVSSNACQTGYQFLLWCYVTYKMTKQPENKQFCGSVVQTDKLHCNRGGNECSWHFFWWMPPSQHYRSHNLQKKTTITSGSSIFTWIFLCIWKSYGRCDAWCVWLSL